MRTLLKVVLFPVTLALTIAVAIGRLICLASGIVLNIIAFVIFVTALGTVILLGEPIRTGIKLAGLAWLISPFGLPIIAAFLVEAVGAFNDTLKAI